MKRTDRMWKWIAGRMPRRLAYFATIRVWANATSGPEAQHATDVTVDAALRRWPS